MNLEPCNGNRDTGRSVQERGRAYRGLAARPEASHLPRRVRGDTVFRDRDCAVTGQAELLPAALCVAHVDDVHPAPLLRVYERRGRGGQEREVQARPLVRLEQRDLLHSHGAPRCRGVGTGLQVRGQARATGVLLRHGAAHILAVGRVGAGVGDAPDRHGLV